MGISYFHFLKAIDCNTVVQIEVSAFIEPASNIRSLRRSAFFENAIDAKDLRDAAFRLCQQQGAFACQLQIILLTNFIHLVHKFLGGNPVGIVGIGSRKVRDAVWVFLCNIISFCKLIPFFCSLLIGAFSNTLY